MELISEPKRLAHVFRMQLNRCAKIHFAVAWASAGFLEFEALHKARRKIERAVIGTHFYQTDPQFIKRFVRHKRVRFVLDHSDLFHPKIYLFERLNGEWFCIIGSANFTRGGFGKNHEASLLVESSDDPSGSLLINVKRLIHECWTTAENSLDLDRYTKARNRHRRAIDHIAGRFGLGEDAGNPIEFSQVLNLTWRQFLARVMRDQHHSTEGRIAVLQAAHRHFSEYNGFDRMPAEVRGCIAGYRKERTLEWGWFGAMGAAFDFKRIVYSKPLRFSEALDFIPMQGPVTREDYISYVTQYRKAFLRKNKQTGHGLGTATRLLAMKRPDYFVCLDSANSAGLFRDFGVSVKRHDYEGYWDKIIERLMLADWWNAPRPKNRLAAAVWDGRAAMLDAVFYEG